MLYLYMLVFYSFVSPFMFGHCVGLERLFILSSNSLSNFHFYAKNFLFATLSSALAYALMQFIFSPLHLTSIFPIALVSLLFFLEKGIFYLYEVFISGEHTLAQNERIFTFGTVILALYEGEGFWQVLFLVCISFVLLFVFARLLRSIRKKIDTFNIENRWRALPLLLTTFGMICTAFYFMDLFY